MRGQTVLGLYVKAVLSPTDSVFSFMKLQNNKLPNVNFTHFQVSKQ